jgi:ribosomal protein S18 acetylase RimI-like enzyme
VVGTADGAHDAPAVPAPLPCHEPGSRTGRRTAGFLIGFHSPSRPGSAYIHFVGVAPDERRTGLARRLYAAFFDAAIQVGCTTVSAITGPVNTGSIAFHKAMGFTVRGPVPDYDGPGADRMVFERSLA